MLKFGYHDDIILRLKFHPQNNSFRLFRNQCIFYVDSTSQYIDKLCWNNIDWTNLCQVGELRELKTTSSLTLVLTCLFVEQHFLWKVLRCVQTPAHSKSLRYIEFPSTLQSHRTTTFWICMPMKLFSRRSLKYKYEHLIKLTFTSAPSHRLNQTSVPLMGHKGSMGFVFSFQAIHT